MILSRRRHPVYLAIAAPLWLGCATGARAQAPVPHGSCAVLDLSKPVIDSMVSTARSACGPVRLIIPRPAARIRQPAGTYSSTEGFRVYLAVENASASVLEAPAQLQLDSARLVHRGAVLAGRDPTYEYGLPFELYDSPHVPLSFGPGPDGRTKLRAGGRSAARELVFTTQMPAQGLRLWLSLRVGAAPPRPIDFASAEHPAGPMPQAVTRFLDAQQLPSERSRTVLFRDPGRDVTIFSVSYGAAQDCEAGCFHSGATGIQAGAKIGWIRTDDYDEGDARKAALVRAKFRLERSDRALLDADYLLGLSARRDRVGRFVNDDLLRMVLAEPFAPRRLIDHVIDSLYARDDRNLATLLDKTPAVVQDVAVLTRLALLPPAYGELRHAALVRLHAMGDRLAKDPSTPAALILALAGEMRSSDGPLVRRLREHPNARRNIAVQLALRDPSGLPAAWARGVSLVNAPPAMKEALERHLRDTSGEMSFRGEGAQLVLDADRGGYTDVLIALSMASRNQSVAAEAGRRLPAGALLRNAR